MATDGVGIFSIRSAHLNRRLDKEDRPKKWLSYVNATEPVMTQSRSRTRTAADVPTVGAALVKPENTIKNYLTFSLCKKEIDNKIRITNQIDQSTIRAIRNQSSIAKPVSRLSERLVASNEATRAKKQLKALANQLGVTVHVPASATRNLAMKNVLEKFLHHKIDISGTAIYSGDIVQSQLLGMQGKYLPSAKVVLIENTKPEDYKQFPGTVSASIESAMAHELMHAAHFKKVGREQGFQYQLQEFTPEAKKIARGVSSYAATNPSEFVAEVGALLIEGKPVDSRAMTMYRALNGPQIRQ